MSGSAFLPGFARDEPRTRGGVILDDAARACRVTYEPTFLSPAEASAWMERLRVLPFVVEAPVMFGKPMPVRRQSCGIGEPGARYRYTGLERVAAPWPEGFGVILERLREHTGRRFNFALCNLYPDGDAGLGWHADDEDDLVRDAPIASLSLGATRDFAMRLGSKGKACLVVALGPGSLLVMGGGHATALPAPCSAASALHRGPHQPDLPCDAIAPSHGVRAAGAFDALALTRILVVRAWHARCVGGGVTGTPDAIERADPPTEPEASAPVILRLRDVCKRFGDVEVLRGVDLDVRRGEILTLLGASGSGKSVLLKLIMGLLPLDRGEIVFDGAHVERMDTDALSAYRRRVGMVFQGGALFDSMTVAENLAYGPNALGRRVMSRDTVRSRVAWALAAVGMSETGDLRPEELSGGMRKRVSIARTIALKPEVILYDEPTTGLDPINAGRIGKLIVQLRKQLGVTSVIVTHDLQVAFKISDRLALLHDGHIAAVGSVAAVRASLDPVVKGFLGGLPPPEGPTRTV